MNLKKIIGTITLMAALTISSVNATETQCSITYIDMGVPEIQSYFKTWMDYRTISDISSPQYDLVNNISNDWVYTDDEGFLRAYGEYDLGIPEDYYVIALGSYYGSTITNKYRITTDTGRVFYGILGDQKADIHTNSTNQYAGNNDVVEFLVNTDYLNRDVMMMGSANVYMPLNGNIQSIEAINFVWE